MGIFYGEQHRSTCIKHKFINHAKASPPTKEIHQEGNQHELCATVIAVCVKRICGDRDGHMKG